MICVVIENNVVMIASSIPTLRPLMRKNTGSSIGTPAGYTYGSSGPPKNPASVETYGQSDTSKARASKLVEDDDSEEHILRDLSSVGNQITKTTNLQVAYEERMHGGLEKFDSSAWPESLEKASNDV